MTVIPISFSKEARRCVNFYSPRADGYHASLEALGYQSPALVYQLLANEGVRWSRPPHILDVAAGTGSVAMEFNKHVPGLKISAMDVSDKMLEALKANLPKAERFQASAEGPFPFERETFDVVTLIGGIEHLKDLANFFTETARVLRPGGWMMVDMLEAMNDTGDIGMGIPKYLRAPGTVGRHLVQAGLKLEIGHREFAFTRYKEQGEPLLYLGAQKPL